jgi:hypothetical protein
LGDNIEGEDRFALYHYESKHFGSHDYRIEYDVDWTGVSWRDSFKAKEVSFRIRLGEDEASVLERNEVSEDIGELIGLLFDLEEHGDLIS